MSDSRYQLQTRWRLNATIKKDYKTGPVKVNDGILADSWNSPEESIVQRGM